LIINSGNIQLTSSFLKVYFRRESNIFCQSSYGDFFLNRIGEGKSPICLATGESINARVKREISSLKESFSLAEIIACPGGYGKLPFVRELTTNLNNSLAGSALACE